MNKTVNKARDVKNKDSRSWGRKQNDSEDTKLLKMLNGKTSKIQLQTTVWEKVRIQQRRQV